MKFPYPRLHFLIRFMALLAFLIAAIYLFEFQDPSYRLPPEMVLIFILPLVAVLILAVTPLFTSHKMDEDGIQLRNGLVYHIKISFDSIENVQPVEHKLWALGFLPTLKKWRVILATGNRNLVSIKLKSRKRFPMLLWHSADEIIIDLVNPGEFVKQANEKIKR